MINLITNRLKNSKGGYSIFEMILAITLFSFIIVLITPIIGDTTSKSLDHSKKIKAFELIKNTQDKLTYLRNSGVEIAENNIQNSNIYAGWEESDVSKSGEAFADLEGFYKIEYGDCPNNLRFCLIPSSSGDEKDFMVDIGILNQEFTLNGTKKSTEVSLNPETRVYTVNGKELNQTLCNTSKICFKTAIKITSIKTDPNDSSKPYYRPELYKNNPVNPNAPENPTGIKNPAKNITLFVTYYTEDGKEVKETANFILTAYKSIPSY